MAKFKPGNQFGGRSPGRPKGQRDRFNGACDKTASEHSARVLQATLLAACNGDVAAQKGVFIKVKLPFLVNATDVEKASAQVIDDLANGRLRSDEGEAIHAALRRHVEIKTGAAAGELLEEALARLAQLEKKLAEKERGEIENPFAPTWPQNRSAQ